MAPRSEDPKLIIRVTNLELVQPICSAYVNVTDRRTDGQTDGRLTIAIPRFALRASRSNNRRFSCKLEKVNKKSLKLFSLKKIQHLLRICN